MLIFIRVLRFLWRHKGATLLTIALLAVIGSLLISLYRARSLADDYQVQLANYDVVTRLHEGAFLQQTARADLAETLIREYNPQPGTKAAYHAEVKIVYKTRTVRVPIVEQKIVYRDKKIEISGDIDDDGIDLSY